MALHLTVYWVLFSTAAGPDLGFQIELPSEVDFGLTEESQVAVPPAAPPVAAPPPAPVAPAANETADVGDAVVDAGPRRRNRRDAGLDAAPATSSDAGAGDAQTRDGSLADASLDASHDAANLFASADAGAADGGPIGLAAAAPRGTVALPAGAQIALRLDMEILRASRLAPDIAQLLGAIPDWQMILAGSGIDPLRDVDRVLIASPNLRREQMFFAGRFRGDTEQVRNIVAAMASSRSVSPEWRVIDGMQVARWASDDTTERHIALLGGSYFAIARLEDIPKVIALAEVRRAREDAGAAALSGPESLLWMAQGHGVSIEIDGAQRFVRGPMARNVPSRLRAVIYERSPTQIALEIEGTFENETLASDALPFWEQQKNLGAQQINSSSFGLYSDVASALRRGTFRLDDQKLVLEVVASVSTMRRTLGLLQMFLPRPPSSSARSSNPQPPPAPPP